ncbi:hypothetical protein [Methylobrevis pamukkalensis]|uniref:hypothetical protein n=1 Tax=Methylobrevis pamukkalensis TaxID=1439726 RepID=UPI00114D055D|nr:hypothetical protein [Methylobrevis pamukkalensis]
MQPVILSMQRISRRHTFRSLAVAFALLALAGCKTGGTLADGRYHAGDGTVTIPKTPGTAFFGDPSWTNWTSPYGTEFFACMAASCQEGAKVSYHKFISALRPID